MPKRSFISPPHRVAQEPGCIQISNRVVILAVWSKFCKVCATGSLFLHSEITHQGLVAQDMVVAPAKSQDKISVPEKRAFLSTRFIVWVREDEILGHIWIPHRLWNLTSKS